jgi:myosin heavy subunit
MNADYESELGTVEDWLAGRYTKNLSETSYRMRVSILGSLLEAEKAKAIEMAHELANAERQLVDRKVENNSLRQQVGSLKSIVDRSGRREWVKHEHGMVRKANSARQEASHLERENEKLKLTIEEGLKREDALKAHVERLREAIKNRQAVERQDFMTLEERSAAEIATQGALYRALSKTPAQSINAVKAAVWREAAEKVRLAGVECLQAGPMSMNDMLLLSNSMRAKAKACKQGGEGR